MTNVPINVLIDDLAHPDYPHRFSRSFDPLHDVGTMIKILKNEGFIWTLSSRGLASIWVKDGNLRPDQSSEISGEYKQFSAEASTPEEALCKVYIEAKQWLLQEQARAKDDDVGL